MSIFTWIFKSKKKMSFENTKPVRVGKYNITKHAQHRITQSNRKTNKYDMLKNLFTKPNVLTNTKIDNAGRPSYNRIGKKHTTAINPTNNNVTSIRVVSQTEIKRHNFKKGKRGNYYVKKNK